MDCKLEVIVVPVSDVDRSRHFYRALGFRLDRDDANGRDLRVVQLTPPGSACSIVIGTGLTSALPGSCQGLHLVVDDLVAARAEFACRGVAISEVSHDLSGVFHQQFASFHDPDGNGWILEQSAG
ncbi:VOC family protein [Kribbella sp. NPDC004875]|uniref:VOC family protein n=1 Tax=Kribbella sp. NPDC004875 TaxID=3364107 RepID=UPI00369974A5